MTFLYPVYSPKIPNFKNLSKKVIYLAISPFPHPHVYLPGWYLSSQF